MIVRTHRFFLMMACLTGSSFAFGQSVNELALTGDGKTFQTSWDVNQSWSGTNTNSNALSQMFSGTATADADIPIPSNARCAQSTGTDHAKYSFKFVQVNVRAVLLTAYIDENFQHPSGCPTGDERETTDDLTFSFTDLANVDVVPFQKLLDQPATSSAYRVVLTFKMPLMIRHNEGWGPSFPKLVSFDLILPTKADADRTAMLLKTLKGAAAKLPNETPVVQTKKACNYLYKGTPGVEDNVPGIMNTEIKNESGDVIGSLEVKTGEVENTILYSNRLDFPCTCQVNANLSLLTEYNQRFGAPLGLYVPQGKEDQKNFRNATQLQGHIKSATFVDWQVYCVPENQGKDKTYNPGPG